MIKRFLFFLVSVLSISCLQKKNNFLDQVVAIERDRVLTKVDTLIDLEPITISQDTAVRSAGTVHDFYSEGDYWWPDPQNPEGPYIRRDGLTNPDNFTAHRESMLRFSQIVGALGSAYQITGDIAFAKAIQPHLHAWFVHPQTRMNPSLNYGQAIKGKTTGRGIGIIDTVHLVEVALSIERIQNSGVLTQSELSTIKNWFAHYVEWLTTSTFGQEERDNGNNHSVTWALQVTAFARVAGDQDQLQKMRNFYKQTLLPQQMAADGSFPEETSRTKPYGYSIFNLDAMTALAQLLSTKDQNLFDHQTDQGLSLSNGMEFLYPFLKDKSSWPYDPDVMYWENWPVAQPSLLFSSYHYQEEKYMDLWKTLDRDFSMVEVVRNMPVKHYTLWFDDL
ncbi:alginate lyase family protein [Nonlabens agnitus]|uniref:Alginate lyase n=1 Tax=Nonlabens agnitus TaxID=870484 RepID=A0A2S9WT84_9FLAO|nr:alginate lyase family protein [Nonlabens agnitus]PRP66693.1 alginate lyase [Nonlabens agnitus]